MFLHLEYKIWGRVLVPKQNFQLPYAYQQSIPVSLLIRIMDKK